MENVRFLMIYYSVILFSLILIGIIKLIKVNIETKKFYKALKDLEGKEFFDKNKVAWRFEIPEHFTGFSLRSKEEVRNIFVDRGNKEDLENIIKNELIK